MRFRTASLFLTLFLATCLMGSCLPAAPDLTRGTGPNFLPKPAGRQTVIKPPDPTATARPTESPPEILYRENFDYRTTCFNLDGDAEGVSLGIHDGSYHIRVEDKNALNTRCNGSYDNFVLEFDLTILDGDVHSLFGLMFRINMGSSYNIFFSAEDDFCWDYFDLEQDRYSELAGCWGQLPKRFIIGETARIQVIASGENLALLVDEEVVTTISDRSGADGTFGFFVIHNGPGSTEIQLDNILIRALTIHDIGRFRPDQTGF